MSEDRNDICMKIKAELETLSTAEVEELFKILHSNNCSYSRNNNGVFINLSWLSEDILLKIKQYIEFCGESRKEINKYENMRKNLNIDMNTSEVEDAVDDNIEPVRDETEKEDAKDMRKTNTNTKFYLMKKKFQKSLSATNKLIEDVLTYDDVVISR